MINLENKPILFVHSITGDKIDYEGQKIYDSRKGKYSLHIRHRLEDISAFLCLNKRVFLTIILKDDSVSGEVLEIVTLRLKMLTNFGIKELNIFDILEIKIEQVI